MIPRLFQVTHNPQTFYSDMILRLFTVTYDSQAFYSDILRHFIVTYHPQTFYSVLVEGDEPGLASGEQAAGRGLGERGALPLLRSQQCLR